MTVVTPDPALWRNSDNLHELSSQLSKHGIKRLLTDHRWRFLDPETLICRNRGLAWVLGGSCRRLVRWWQVEPAVGWVKPAELACASLTPSDVDLILATGSPFLTFSLAKRLAAKLGCPYVLDYRDPLTENPHISSPVPRRTIQAEKKLLADSAAAIIVSPSWAEAIDRRFSAGPKLHVVTNAYDPEEMAGVEPYKFDHPALVYTGNFYPPKRVVTPIMAALKHLKETSNAYSSRWYFHYYGDWLTHVRDEADRFGVSDRIVLHGNVSRRDALAAVRGAAATVVIASVFSEDKQIDRGIIPGKLFEALGLGNPILLIASRESDAARIVEETGAGQAFMGEDSKGIARFLSQITQTPHERINCGDTYSWPATVLQLDSILRRVIAIKHPV